MAEQRIRQGDFIQFVAISSVVTTLVAIVYVEFDGGGRREFRTNLTTGSARASNSITFGNMEKEGVVTRAVVAVQSGSPQRGQTYVLLRVRDRNRLTVGELVSDYVFGSHLALFPFIIGPESGAGSGFREPRAVADDIAPADIQEPIAVTGATVRIDGFIWYYHCSGDVATRTLRASIRDLGPGLPTGMTSGANTRIQRWPSAGTLDLTANQEGMMFVSGLLGKAGFATSSDDGTQTLEPTTTQPIPFPYWARPTDVGEFFFDVTDEEAADRHSIYILQEEWIGGS